MPALPLVPRVVLLVSSLAFCLEASIQAQAAVDFSQPPPAGLRVRFTEGRTTSTESFKSVEEAMPAQSTHSSSAQLVYVDTVRQVGERGIEVIERRFESSRTVLGDATKPGATVIKHPVAGMRFRAIWDPRSGDCRIEILEGEKWRAASAGEQRRVTSERMRFPLLPLPTREVRVGESWRLSPDEVERHLGRYVADLRAVAGSRPEVDLEAVFRLVGVEERAGCRCAKIEIKITRSSECESQIGGFLDRLQGRAKTIRCSTSQKIEGNAWYSLRDRVVIGLTLVNSWSKRTTTLRHGEQTNGGASGLTRHAAKGEILEAHSKEATGGESSPRGE